MLNVCNPYELVELANLYMNNMYKSNSGRTVFLINSPNIILVGKSTTFYLIPHANDKRKFLLAKIFNFPTENYHLSLK